jgi:NitT/TauT family transport system permease protein
MNLQAKSLSHSGIIAIWIIVLLLLWELSAWLIRVLFVIAAPDNKLPYFHRVLGAVVMNFPTLLKQGGISFGNSLMGFAIGALFGLLLAVLMSVSKTAEYTISPYAISSQMVPIIGLAPIIYGIVHDAAASRVLMAAYVTFFPVTIHTLRGLKSVPAGQLEFMRAYAASSWTTYTKLKLISALPSLFSGLKIAAPLAITAAIVVELMGAPDGIGVLMLSSLYYGNAQINMFWSTVLASIGIGFAAFLLISLVERLVTPWQPEFRAQRRGEI